MCGIAGILFSSDQATLSRPQFSDRLQAMNDSMQHRGPDGDGLWVDDHCRVGLAHRRLAIIDLSPDAAQPMTNSDGSLHLTFNGEIYNHLSLRAELVRKGYIFRTDHSDTEVLIHGYSEWGIDGLVNRLEGMFAFAIWDVNLKKLVMARDRIGIKPLYFTGRNGAFRFASEIKAILSAPDIQRELDPHALNHYLSFMIAPAPLTMFQGIFKLPAAHIMEVDQHGAMDIHRYWDAVPGQGINPDQIAGMSASEKEKFYTTGIRSRLEKAIDKRMMSDVPFGVFLSGGIDSSANVALMSRLMDRPVDTFTVGFKDYKHLNELEYADRIAADYKTNHHEVLIDSSDMQNYLGDLMHHQDEPIADWVCVPLHFVSKLARDSGTTVVQVGEGSDEQFCGYSSYMTYLNSYKSVWNPYTKTVPQSMRRGISTLWQGLAGNIRKLDKVTEVLLRAGRGHEFFWTGANAFWDIHKLRLQPANNISEPGDWSELAAAGLDITGLGSPHSGDIIDGYYKSFDSQHPGQDDLTRMIYSEFRLRLPELLLMRVDKISMASSIEGRVPFLDHDLVEFTMDIPQADKIKNGQSKYLLKQALSDLLPDEIIHRKKMGFAAPVADWLRGDFGAQAQDTVLGSSLMERGLLNRGHIADQFKSHREGRADNALHLWTLFNLAAWHDHWIN